MMKKNTQRSAIVLVTLSLILLQGAEAQKKYVVKMTFINGQQVKGNLLYAAGDSLGVSKKGQKDFQFRLREIKSIRIHRKGGVGRGAAIGAGTGAVLGAVIGVATYEPPHCPSGSFCLNFGSTFNALGGAIVGLIAGSITGALAGSGEKEIKIEADSTQFNLFKKQYGLLEPSLDKR